MSLVSEMNTIADMLEEVGSVIEDSEKEASLFSIGDVLVCVNPIEPIVKGLKYRIIDMPKPNYIVVEDLNGSKIGIFRADRFVKNHNEY